VVSALRGKVEVRLRDGEDFVLDLQVRVEVAAEVAVDQLEPAVRQLVGQQAAAWAASLGL
jgi:hypothetical protein